MYISPGVDVLIRTVMVKIFCFENNNEWRKSPLQWHHNECDGVSNRKRLDCLLNRSFRRRSKETSKHRVAGLCEEKYFVSKYFVSKITTGEFVSQRVSNAENVSIWWRHHARGNDVLMRVIVKNTIQPKHGCYVFFVIFCQTSSIVR